MKTLDYQSRVTSNRYVESERYVRDFDRVNSGQIILDAGAGERRSRFFINNNRYISQAFGEYKGGVSHLTIKARGIDRGIQRIVICCVIFVICLLKITASIW